MNPPPDGDSLQLGDWVFHLGDRGKVDLPVGHLITHEMVNLNVHVRRGTEPGPRLLIVAALHGDEINGIEIVRLLLRRKMTSLRGDLLMLLGTNLPAFLFRSRYLPDRRDLNRLFPGSPTGSLGARLAHVITSELVPLATHAIDLHTGAVNRPNLPQIRIDGALEENLDLARAFAAPAVIEAALRPGSLREAIGLAGIPCLMFEAGEAEILDPASVRIGLRGILRVMRHLGMLPPSKSLRRNHWEPAICTRTAWERAPRGGIFVPNVEMGRAVEVGTILGKIGDPFNPVRTLVRATRAGIVIGRAKNAVVDEGDGLFHIGVTECLESATEAVAAAREQHEYELDQQVFDDSSENA